MYPRHTGRWTSSGHAARGMGWKVRFWIHGYMDSCVICIRVSGVCHCQRRPDLFYGVIEVEDSLRTGTVVVEAGKSRLHALGRIVP